jgi:hypothetical protein
VVFILPVVLLGCADPFAGRKEITGTVTVKGVPMKSGTIYFEPLDSQGTQANQIIEDGKYKIGRPEGLLPGKYIVRLSSADQKASMNEEEAGGPGGSANITFFDIVPPEWNVASKKEVTVKADGVNDFSFDIPNPLQPKKSRR